MRIFVPEPERWTRVKNDRRLAGISDTAAGTFLAVFAPDVGFLIVSSMMIGAFAAASVLPVLVRGLVGPDKAGLAVTLTSEFFMLVNLGAVVGYLTVMWLAEAIGRRWSYFLIILGSAPFQICLCSRKSRRVRGCCSSPPFTASLPWVVLAHSPFTCRNYFRPAYVPPVKVSVGMLRASSRRSVPSCGRDCWSRRFGAAAFDGLPSALKAIAESLWAIHSNLYDYAAGRPEASAAAAKYDEEFFISTVYETEHPLVRVLPGGERSLV
jgi:MFS family permease